MRRFRPSDYVSDRTRIPNGMPPDTTLPVEFDASKRALVWLERSGVAAHMEHEKAKNALFWAAMTYVAAAVGSVAQLLYFLMLALGRRD